VVGRGKRRLGCLGILGVLLVLLVVTFSVADRIVAGIAEERLAEEVAAAARAQNAVPGDTTVEIDGYPFLTQVWSGEYDGGRIGVQELRTQELTIANVDVDVEQLSVPRDVLFGAEPHDITAGRMRGTATVSLAELARRLGVPGLKITGSGSRVTFAAPLTFAGFSTQIEGVADVRLEGSRVWLEVAQISAGGVAVPDAALAPIRRELAAGVTIPPLPYSLRLTGIRVDGGSVRVNAAADNVPLVR
jgi:hypothetical protein